MNFIERGLANLALKRMEEKMGTNWKGKVGAIAALLAAVAAALTDFATNQLSMEKVLAYLSAAGGALSLFGIRHAMGPSKATPTPPAQ